jgi:hypothetical protein
MLLDDARVMIRVSHVGDVADDHSVLDSKRKMGDGEKAALDSENE